MPYPKKTHCKNGHEFTEENTYTVKGLTTRYCKACRMLNEASSHDKHRVEINIRKTERRSRLTKEDRRRENLRQIGWTLERFNSSLVEQNGLCAVCSCILTFEDKAGRTRANADHEHCVPPKPRGVLCGNCNLGIGNLQDNIELLKKAVEYLEKYK
jgi:hypothetical protein